MFKHNSKDQIPEHSTNAKVRNDRMPILRRSNSTGLSKAFGVIPCPVNFPRSIFTAEFLQTFPVSGASEIHRFQ
jgi:hypothetical protein